jgi:hypothetical protein
MCRKGAGVSGWEVWMDECGGAKNESGKSMQNFQASLIFIPEVPVLYGISKRRNQFKKKSDIQTLMRGTAVRLALRLLIFICNI